MDESPYLDAKYLREKLLPRWNHLISTASFAPKRYYVQKVYVVASLVSQEEGVINELLMRVPSFSTTQAGLDWQPDDERRSAGDVYQHLIAMSSFGDCPNAPKPLCKDVESLDANQSNYSHSFRLSSLEICNADKPKGYHIGATALEKLSGFEGHAQECEKWRKLLLKYIVEMDDESPIIVWPEHRRVATAVVWQVQLDIVGNITCRRSRSSNELKRRRRYGTFGQVFLELETPAKKQHKGVQSPGQKTNKLLYADCKSEYKGVRYRPERGPSGVWVAERRLPTAEKKKNNKVSFGDYKSLNEAARAIDAVFHYYGKGPYNFPDSPELLQTCPFPSLDGLKGDEKLEAVKKQAKWLATKPPPLFTSQPSSPISTACSLQETVASPGHSRSDSRESDESDGITLDHINHMMDDLLQTEFQAVDNQCEETTLSSLVFQPCFNLSSLLLDEPYEASTPSTIETSMLSTALFPTSTIETSMLSTALFPPSSIETSMLSTALFPPSSIETSMLGTTLFPPSSIETSMLSTALFPPSSIETSMLSTAPFPPYDWCNQINGDAYATQNISQLSQVSHVSIVSRF